MIESPTYYDLAAGEVLVGTVEKLPCAGGFQGTRLWLRRDNGETLSIAATARKGHIVLERLLADKCVQVGDRIQITFRGMRQTCDGERSYRDYELRVLT